MTAPGSLVELLRASVAANPGREALRDGARSWSYADLGARSGSVAHALRSRGVEPGDRVGVVMRKSGEAVAALLGTLECGAAYVPVDPGNPLPRSAYILRDCGVGAVLADKELAGPLRQALGDPAPAFVTPGDLRAGAPAAPGPAGPGDLAYVLYTSGSTGRPKGVAISHRAARAFVDWCSAEFSPRPHDRFSAHAPFHFDLSVFDLFVALAHGACVVLVDEASARQPRALAALIERERLSVWYSAPSALIALLEHGDLEQRDLSALRLVLFAGEVFPVKHLRRLRGLLPAEVRCFNLYGPTETNVCTFHEIPATIPEDRSQPFPIGRVCPHFEARVADLDGRPVPAGQQGELLIAGPGVMEGYWGLPERTAQAFVEADGRRFYRTGDMVVEGADGVHDFRGRRDRMVKRRGYRIELGEIEAGLHQHPAVREAAVVARTGADGVQIAAVLVAEPRPSLVELKGFCARLLPLYMVPDRLCFREALPRTSTGKVDYQALAAETWTSG